MLDSNLLQIALVYMLGMLTPGPNFFLILSNGVAYGRKSGCLTAFGVVLGTLFWILLSLFGIGLLIKSSPTLFLGLKLLGGSYLLYLSVTKFQKVLSGKEGATLSQPLPSGEANLGYTGLFAQGLTANVFNPKSLLFWLAIFSGLPLSDVGQYPRHALIIAIVIAISFTYHVGLALLAGEMGRRLFGGAWARGINMVAATAFLLFGLTILIGLLSVWY